MPDRGTADESDEDAVRAALLAAVDVAKELFNQGEDRPQVEVAVWGESAWWRGAW